MNTTDRNKQNTAHSSGHHNRPWAIIVGLDHYIGLQTARILARQNIQVVGVLDNPKHPYSRTKACRKILISETTGDGLVDSLLSFGRNLSTKAVLIPCKDMSVLLISRQREQLSRYYRFALPDADVVELLMNKLAFYPYAKAHGWTIPETHILHDHHDARYTAFNCSYPCSLKPPFKTPEWERHTVFKAFKINTPDQFLACYKRCSQWATPLIVQKWVEGSDANHYACYAYFDCHSDPLVTFVSRSLRKWYPITGNTSLGQECRNDTVLSECIRLFKETRFYGMGYLEIKYDALSGQPFIMEPNIGRPTGKSALADASGVDLIYTMYCDIGGLSLPTNRQQHYTGKKWVHLRHDLQAALYYWNRDQLTFMEWYKSFRGSKAYAVFSWKDPLPILGDFFQRLNRKIKIPRMR